MNLPLITQLLPQHIGANLAPTEARYLPLDIGPEPPETYGDYERAVDLARATDLSKCPRIYARLSGKFIFGDYLEALFRQYNLHTKRLIISTYSYSQNNVDSLRLLLELGYVDQLDLLVSDQFYAHERNNGGLVPYTYRQLDPPNQAWSNRFQFGACGTHDKLTFFETDAGSHVCIHGSANFRSSGSIEHIVVEVSKALYDFAVPAIDNLIHYYRTIDKSARHSKAWELATKSSYDKAPNK